MYHLNHKNSIPKVVTQNRIVNQVEHRKNLWFENEQFFMCRSAHDFWLLWKIRFRVGQAKNFFKELEGLSYDTITASVLKE